MNPELIEKLIEELWAKYSSSSYEPDCAPYNVIVSEDFKKACKELLEKIK